MSPPILGEREVRSMRHSGLLTAALLLVACSAPEPTPKAAAAGTAPRLILFVSVDQMRADYLERFESLWTGGFRRLVDESVSFVETRHEHAVTTTSPGHASLVTGAYPSRHGIIDNEWWDANEGDEVYSVADADGERSPRRLRATALGDWMKGANPESRVFAIAGKDRAAILMGGLKADGAYWFERSKGRLASSAFYGGKAKPAWFGEAERTAGAARWFARPWEPTTAAQGVLADPTWRERLRLVEPAQGAFANAFPHVGGGLTPVPTEAFYRAFYGSPMLDALTAAGAIQLLRAEKLGGDGVVDLLAVSFSAVDTVGHTFGPDSPEMLDTLLRLDESLGRLLEAVDAQVGLEHTLIALSADHGVVPLPEASQLLGRPGRRLTDVELLCFQGLGTRLEARFGADDLVDEHWRIDVQKLRRAKVERVRLEAAVQEELAGCAEVERVWARSELEAEPPPSDPFGQLWARSLFPGRGPDFLIQWQEHYLALRGSGTTHGTPYDDDMRVPWLLRLPQGTAGKVLVRAATVDIAPTLAGLVGVTVPSRIDGRDRTGELPR
jgi:Type I phosphodiesterase / nucleotide pyrophosphatase